MVVDCLRNAIEKMMASGRLLTEGLQRQAQSLGVQVKPFDQKFTTNILIVRPRFNLKVRWISLVPQHKYSLSLTFC